MSNRSLHQHFNHPRILIVGCGDVGQRMLPILVKTYKVFALTRQIENIKNIRSLGAMPILGDLDQPASLHRLSQIAPIVIHLAPPNTTGLEDLRTKALLAALGKTRVVERFIYISTTGVYGDCRGQRISETTRVNPENSRAIRRVDAERKIRAWAIQHGVQCTILRVPGIYAGDRLPLDRLKNGTPALLPDQDVYTNHIHADDLARLITLSIYRFKPQRVMNACDFSELKMGEYFDLVADKMSMQRPPRVDKATLSTLVSPQLLSFMQESRRISNDRLHEIGFKFRYPTVSDYLRSI